jgi:thiamine kinase-like enzyme
VTQDARSRAARLSFWSRPAEPRPVSGGITNANFLVEDRGERFFVRIGEDLPVHGVLRWNELAASRAAHAAGISPEVVHAEPGAMVLRYLEGRTLSAEDVHRPETLERIVPLLRTCHLEVGRHLRGPCLVFWVFHVIRNYAHTLRDERHRLAGELPGLQARAERLEGALGPVELCFTHNDLLPANLLDDGKRLWLLDWDYAGFGSALFDLAGLASNCQLPGAREEQLLESYFERPVDDALRRRLSAMKCASLLRESLWSMVSEHHSHVDFDYRTYTADNLAHFERAWAAFEGA